MLDVPSKSQQEPTEIDLEFDLAGKKDPLGAQNGQAKEKKKKTGPRIPAWISEFSDVSVLSSESSWKVKSYNYNRAGHCQSAGPGKETISGGIKQHQLRLVIVIIRKKKWTDPFPAAIWGKTAGPGN